ncbi:MAG: LacI family transcriptional regulator [Gammaproteobacteria bacterium]|nr:LacI family transcriptional regulator [Gammaproteobacteria bacterium]
MSIQSVAKKAGVSVATVSRAFNFPDKVVPATREHVHRVANELGYQPNASARSLRTQRTRVLGVVLPTLLNPVFAECLQGIARAAVAGGYAITPVTTGYVLDEEERAVRQLLAGNVDALILVVSNPAASVALQRLRAAGLPYVLIYNRHPDHPCVSVDNEAAASGAVMRLVSLGHRRIGMVSGTLAASDRAQQRHRGFVRGMKAAGLKARTLEIPFVEDAAASLARFLSATPRLTAVFCSNDLLAVRCIRAAQRGGQNVPRDLSVVGFDGIAIGEDLTPSLSTVTQPNSEIGRQSVELLLRALDSGSPPDAAASRVLPHAFRAGESCAGAPPEAR